MAVLTNIVGIALVLFVATRKSRFEAWIIALLAFAWCALLERAHSMPH